MKSIILFATLCMIASPVIVLAQEKPASAGDKKTAGPSDADFEKAYQQLLEKAPEVREKIENGQATKEDVIAVQNAWAGAIKRISKAYKDKGDYCK